MDVVGSEIGQKMRSAIKAKLTELGCYVDDELPDYVMVMVANKRTRSQMEDDLQLFLGDNTELFVNWLHQVLKKLQEVTVAPLKTVESDKVNERSKSKEKKDKKEKSKKSDGSKKSKKKAKEKAHKKKDERKKSKKRSKHEMIRPNIPPLLMNIEKESEPSITDVFAGQILKNHGIILDTHADEPKIVEKKPVLNETKRPIIPIIDPASIPSQTTTDIEEVSTIDSETVTSIVTENDVSMTMTEDITMLETTEDVVTLTSENVISPKPTDIAPEAENASREDKIKEMNEIEAKIQGLKQKLADQLVSQDDSMSDDEDFLNIRTEADELINDFAEDVFQEISQPPPIATPPLRPRISRSPSPPPPTNNKKKVTSKDIPETLPQIELNLPKRPVRERLGAPIQKKDAVDERDKGRRASEKSTKTPERCTPENAPVERSDRSAKSRLGSQPERSETHRKSSTSDESAKSEHSSKRLTSRVSVLENRPARATCASVVRVRPRPRVGAPASSLLLRAVADAHKSLLNIPPKIDPEPQKVKRALVLPMRRTVDPKKIVIQVPCNNAATNSAESVSDGVSLGNPDSEEEESPRGARNLTDKEEYKMFGITKVIQNTDYVPSRTLIRRDDTLLVETINIHNTTVDKDKDTQFIVTMDGYHPNAFLAKKLMTEGLLNDDDNDVIKKPNQSDNVEKSKNGDTIYERAKKIADIVSQDTTETSEKSTDQTMDEDRDVIEKEKSDNIIEDPTPENRSNVAVAKLIPEKRKSDITPDNLILEKRKRDIPPETPIFEKRKREVLVVKPILETENDNSIEISAPEKRKSSRSTNKPVPEGKESDISADIPVLDMTSSDISLDRPTFEKQKSEISLESSASENDKSSPVKRRRASPIVFDVHKAEKIPERVRERTVSASSDGHVVLTTSTNSHKYDALPPLSQAAKVVWCRAFPQCRYGQSCAFAHPRCKFAAACTRRGCMYSHAPNAIAAPTLPSAPVVASHVVPAANYKSISAAAFAGLCKYYPNCSNPACHYYHPKPCRYGKACTNKLECNFYHHDVPGGKWMYSV